MVITDLSDKKSRSSQLGKLGLSYGVGMVIGPVVGGLCTKYSSEQAAAFVAAAGSLLSVALVLMFVPKNTKALRPHGGSDKVRIGLIIFYYSSYTVIYHYFNICNCSMWFSSVVICFCHLIIIIKNTKKIDLNLIYNFRITILIRKKEMT